MLSDSPSLLREISNTSLRTKMDQINKKIRQMRRFKVFKRPSKRAKTPTRDPSVSIPSASHFKCPNCCAEKSEVATQTSKLTEVDSKTQTLEIAVVDASIQVSFTPTRIPRLLGSKYSGSSDSSVASPPINHDASCQTMDRSDSPTDTIQNEASSRPSSASTLSDALPHKKSSSKHKLASNAREKSIRCQRTFQTKPVSPRIGTKSSIKSESCLKGATKSVLDSGDSEKEEVLEGKNKGHVRRSSSSSGIPVHVKLRSLQSPRARHLGIGKEAPYFPAEFNASSTNSSDLSSPRCGGDFAKGSSEDDSDPAFWNADERYSILSETYTLEGAGDFLENDPLSSPDAAATKSEPCTPMTGAASGIRKPSVFLHDSPGEHSRCSATTP